MRPGREFGSVYALDHLWRELELGESLAELARGRRFAWPDSDVVKAMLSGWVFHPGSERALIATWSAKAAAAEFEGVELQHAWRALPIAAEVGPGHPVAREAHHHHQDHRPQRAAEDHPHRHWRSPTTPAPRGEVARPTGDHVTHSIHRNRRSAWIRDVPPASSKQSRVRSQPDEALPAAIAP